MDQHPLNPQTAVQKFPLTPQHEIWIFPSLERLHFTPNLLWAEPWPEPRVKWLQAWVQLSNCKSKPRTAFWPPEPSLEQRCFGNTFSPEQQGSAIFSMIFHEVVTDRLYWYLLKNQTQKDRYNGFCVDRIIPSLSMQLAAGHDSCGAS